MTVKASHPAQRESLHARSRPDVPTSGQRSREDALHRYLRMAARQSLVLDPTPAAPTAPATHRSRRRNPEPQKEERYVVGHRVAVVEDDAGIVEMHEL